MSRHIIYDSIGTVRIVEDTVADTLQKRGFIGFAGTEAGGARFYYLMNNDNDGNAITTDRLEQTITEIRETNQPLTQREFGLLMNGLFEIDQRKKHDNLYGEVTPEEVELLRNKIRLMRSNYK